MATPTSGPSTLHGAQLGVALPEAAREAAPDFAHHRPDPVKGTGWQARVFLGSLLGEPSPVETYTPLLGAELLLQSGVILELPIDPTFEHGVLVDTGSVALGCDHGGTTRIIKDELAYAPPGSATLALEADERTRALRTVVDKHQRPVPVPARPLPHARAGKTGADRRTAGGFLRHLTPVSSAAPRRPIGSSRRRPAATRATATRVAAYLEGVTQVTGTVEPPRTCP